MNLFNIIFFVICIGILKIQVLIMYPSTYDKIKINFVFITVKNIRTDINTNSISSPHNIRVL